MQHADVLEPVEARLDVGGCVERDALAELEPQVQVVGPPHARQHRRVNLDAVALEVFVLDHQAGPLDEADAVPLDIGHPEAAAAEEAELEEREAVALGLGEGLHREVGAEPLREAQVDERAVFERLVPALAVAQRADEEDQRPPGLVIDPARAADLEQLGVARLVLDIAADAAREALRRQLPDALDVDLRVGRTDAAEGEAGEDEEAGRQPARASS